MHSVEKIYHYHFDQVIVNFYKEIEEFFVSKGFNFQVNRNKYSNEELYFTLNGIPFILSEDNASLKIYTKMLDTQLTNDLEEGDSEYEMHAFDTFEDIIGYLKEYFPTYASRKVNNTRKTGILEVKKFNEVYCLLKK
jgi:hypothetical protein